MTDKEKAKLWFVEVYFVYHTRMSAMWTTGKEAKRFQKEFKGKTEAKLDYKLRTKNSDEAERATCAIETAHGGTEMFKTDTLAGVIIHPGKDILSMMADREAEAIAHEVKKQIALNVVGGKSND